MVQWLGLHVSNTRGSIPGQGTKIPHSAQHSQKHKSKQNDTKKNKIILKISPDIAKCPLVGVRMGEKEGRIVFN